MGAYSATGVLEPVRIYDTDPHHAIPSTRFIQWHFVSARKGDQELQYMLAKNYLWAFDGSNVHWGDMLLYRHYLGYHRDCRINLGTGQGLLMRIAPSDAPPEKISLRLTGMQASLGTEGLSIFVSHSFLWYCIAARPWFPV